MAEQNYVEVAPVNYRLSDIPFICQGRNDQEVINQALHNLTVAITGEELIVPAMQGLGDLGPWRPAHGDEQLCLVEVDEGTKALRMQRLGRPMPGVCCSGVALNLTPYKFLEFRCWADVIAKIRFTTTDSQNNSRYYQVKIIEARKWVKLRILLDHPYMDKEGCNIAAIDSITMEYMNDEPGTILAVTDLILNNEIKLNHPWIQPGSLRLSFGEDALEQNRDYSIDWETGNIWFKPGGCIEPGSCLIADYRHGRGVLRLLPGRYYIDVSQPKGITPPSFCTLDMNGAVLEAYNQPSTDMAFFHLPELSFDLPLSGEGRKIFISGGEIQGMASQWPLNVSVYGVALYNTSDVEIRDVVFQDLNGPAISVGADPGKSPVQNVRILRNQINNCGASYFDVPGQYYGSPAKNLSKAALNLFRVYHFLIGENSVCEYPGDGSWIYKCKYGTICNNTIRDGSMGAYFCESSTHITGTGNRMIRTGSRGVTIERGSNYNVFTGNIVEESGREAIWLIGSSGCVLEGNVLHHNGQRRHLSHSASIKVDWDADKAFAQYETHGNVIANNVIISDIGQEHAIWITSGERCSDTLVAHNNLCGMTTDIRDEGMSTRIIDNKTSRLNDERESFANGRQ